MKTRVVLLLAVGCLAAAGCESPEAMRTRGGGPGSDPGNRPASVKMHEGSDEYWRTPQRTGVRHAPIDSARQARQADRR